MREDIKVTSNDVAEGLAFAAMFFAIFYFAVRAAGAVLQLLWKAVSWVFRRRIAEPALVEAPAKDVVDQRIRETSDWYLKRKASRAAKSVDR